MPDGNSDPTPAPPASLRSHEIDYRLLGAGKQILEVLLDPEETAIAEAGAFLAKTSHIKMSTRASDRHSANPLRKMARAALRVAAGESVFLTHFTNEGPNQKEPVWFAAPHPGDFIPVDLAKLEGPLLCQRGAFIAGAYGTEISFAFTRRVTAAMFGGEGLTLQRVSGDGLLVLHAAGGAHQVEVKEDAPLQVDPGCLVAFEESLKFGITRVGGLRSMLFAGEGIVLGQS
ncbi:MAG: AIM24 family protein [Gemmatimonadetes bacterium]|nr:AIM24 family protein [Gemmatimonadota bacterium]